MPALLTSTYEVVGNFGHRVHGVRDALGIRHIQRNESRYSALLFQRLGRVATLLGGSRPNEHVKSLRPVVARPRSQFLYLLR